MVAGNAANTDPSKVTAGNICHRCWTSTSEDTFVGAQPCSGSDTVDIPTATNCQMIRQTIIFPAYVSTLIINLHILAIISLQGSSDAGTGRILTVQTIRVMSHTLEPARVAAVHAHQPTP